MGSLTKILTLGFLLFSNLIFAKSASSYLSALDDARYARFQLEEAKGKLAMSKDSEHHAEELYKMMEKLFRQHAASEEEYRRALLKRDLTVAKRKEAVDFVEFAEASLSMEKKRIDHALGNPLTLVDLHAAFIRKWKAECLVTKGATEATQAEVTLHQYLYQVARLLYQKQATSYEDVLNKEQGYRDAKERHAKNLALGEICPQHMPTIEEVKKLFPSDDL